jgi:hypothetical protein
MPKEDEVKLPTQEELLKVIEGEDGEHEELELQSEGPKYTEREQQALNFGWKPKDQWIEGGGDPEDWRPARDFLERGEMIGKIRSLTKETQETQRALRVTMEQNSKIYQTGYTQAIADLKTERRQALADGDLLKADEISEKIESTQAELAKVKQPIATQQRVDPDHVQWVEQNQWYNDPVMQKFADSLAQEYVIINKGQVEPNDVRDFVSKTVRKEFAHRFEPQKVRAAPNPDGNGSQAASSSKGNTGDTARLSKIEAEMPDEHKQIMKTMLKADPNFKKADYLKMYMAAK